jgi:methylmalonyl-CoA mutase C-terminal domain/subunit
MEVIYTGLRQTPAMVIESAIQEDVNVIGISILSGAHMNLFPEIINLMKEKDMHDVLLVGGGIISNDDAKILKESGVGEIFGPGTSLSTISEHIKKWYTTINVNN